VDLRQVAATFGPKILDDLQPTLAELIGDELLQQKDHCICLTPRGRLLSNDVFQAFLAPAALPARTTKTSV
jgi:oxygen-independent coproporphyrinogen-3 oxidase